MTLSRRPSGDPGSDPPATAACAPAGDQRLALLLAVQAARAEGAGIPQHAARAALHFFHVRAGSPSALRVLATVQEGRAWVDPKKGCKVDLVFSTERYNPEEGEDRLGKCSARVFFKKKPNQPSV
jgi:hypothetical protein